MIAQETTPATEEDRRRYIRPQLEKIGSTTKLIQGCGGMSGTDRNYYYHWCPGE